MTAIPFDNTFARLPAQMFTTLAPTPVQAPAWIARNDALAATLGIDAEWFGSDEALAVFAGNAPAAGSHPLAQLYAAHQFGHWNPQLGDGRAILLGEVVGTDGLRRDIQLKGSGRTPYSRSGDGRSWLGPVLREHLVSEAMHAMGVPTTRALAAVSTGEDVYREARLPGAILTRVAQSHIRVGTFQVHASRGDLEALTALFDHTVARHYPDAKTPNDLLHAVVQAQAELVAKWMGLGFIHGVMNTDNCSVAGETIDYGPCAFMDNYHPGKVFSSIDQMGRYAYGNQPGIAAWNCAQLATSLIPLMPDRDAAITQFTETVNTFAVHYEAAYLDVFATKLGLADRTAQDRALVDDLLVMMADGGSDFTNVFATLGTDAAADQFTDRDGFAAWQARWVALRTDDHLVTMAQANPQIIPRNHQIEAVITAAVTGDLGPFHRLLSVITQPYAPLDENREAFAIPPTDQEVVTQTFCGT